MSEVVKNLKMVVVDIDGTLLNSQHQMGERTEKALKAAIEKGIQVVLATGKTRISGDPIIQKLGLKTPGIYLQGLAIYDADGTARHMQALDPAVARRVITFAEDRGYLLAAYSGTRILIRAPVPGSDQLTTYNEPLAEVVGPLQNVLEGMPINKLIAFGGDPRRVKALRWQLDMQLNGSVKLTQALDSMLEILPPGASKGAALRVLLKEMGISAEDVLAIGDAENDIEMIQLAGVGVAVGNADAKTQASAKYVVASNDADGVGEAVERFVIGASA
jgi:Cof subfamily protein (haloacid dehalogenase superfamily)